MKDIAPFKVFTEEVIICTKDIRGTGDNELSPVRRITEVFSKDGEKIAEYDPCGDAETFTATDLTQFAEWHRKNLPTTPPQIGHVLNWIDSLK